MSKKYQLNTWIKHQLRAKGADNLHSPFVFDLYTNTIRKDELYFPAFNYIEERRKDLQKNQNIVSGNDFGTGKGIDRTVSQIVSSAAKNAKHGRLLHRLALKFKPENVLEFGSNAGISTAYISSALNSSAKFFSIEGNAGLAQLARETIDSVNQNQSAAVVSTFAVPVILEGEFDKVLPQLLPKMDKLDLVFFDGNHRYQPTINYFNSCLPKVHNDTVFIFDDIHWSEEMTQAWNEIKSREEVSVTIDLYQIGLVFFRKEQKKENFLLR